MKDRILRLCRRLDKFTLDEISTIAEDVDEAVLELLLLTLVKEGKLTLRNDLYFYNKQSFNKKYSNHTLNHSAVPVGFCFIKTVGQI